MITDLATPVRAVSEAEIQTMSIDKSQWSAWDERRIPSGISVELKSALTAESLVEP